MKEFDNDRPINSVNFGRRATLKVGLAVGGALVTTHLLRGEKQIRQLEKINPLESLLKTSSLELRLSQVKAGIIDIHDHKGRLINNLVMVVSWVNNGTLHFNNSEIQKNPIETLSEASAKATILKYAYDRKELRPAKNPASNLRLESRITPNSDGSINLDPRITDNPNYLKNIRIGLGCFYGINHGTFEVLVNTTQGQIRVTPTPLKQPTEYGNADEIVYVNDTSRGLELNSIYPEINRIQLELNHPTFVESIFVPSLSLGTVVIGTRNNPWEPSQNPLHRKLTSLTGEKEWIESAILFSRSKNPSYRLNLSSIR